MHYGSDEISNTTVTPDPLVNWYSTPGTDDMSKSIRILHLEDDSDDAALVAAMLRRGGIECTITRVVDRDEFIATLEDGATDIVISDMTLPRFSGMEALSIVRERFPEIPFIFLSGNIGEETAIETLLLGARDYVLKHRMQRLLPAMRRVLREADESKKRREAEKEVRRMQEWTNRISAIVSRSPIVAFSWKPETGWPVTFVSDNVSQFGYTPADFLTNGLLYADIVHPDDIASMEMEFNQFSASFDAEKTMEYRILHKDGRTIWVEEHTTAVRDQSSRIVAVEGVIIDITERKLHDIDQQLNASRMEKLYELASMESIDEQSLVDRVLDHAVTLTGSSVGYVHFIDADGGILKSYWSGQCPDPCRKASGGRTGTWPEAALKECLITPGPIVNNASFGLTVSCDSSEEPLMLKRHAAVPISADGRVVMIAGVGNKQVEYDDSDVRMVQLMLIEMWRMMKHVREAAERRKLWRAVEHSPTAIAVTDIDGVIEYANPKLLAMSGYTQNEVVGAHARLFRSGEQGVEYYRELWDTILSGKEWTGTLRNMRKDGSLYWEEMHISPVSDESGVIMNFVAIKVDVSERIAMEQALIAAGQEAERTAKLKDHFIALISHEIRTPLNVIFGYSGLIREVYAHLIEPLDQYMFETIEDSGKRLMRTVDLLIAASSLGTGSYSPIIVEFDANAVLGELLQEYNHQAKQKGLTLEYRCDAPEVKVRLDQFGFEQVMHNIIDNAVKFTPAGGVFVSCALETDEIRIDIRDTGPGMSDEFIQRAFNPFTQENEGYSRPYEGLGLGLTLAKKYIEINGGRLTIQSAKGQGSVFTVYFPLPA